MTAPSEPTLSKPPLLRFTAIAAVCSIPLAVGFFVNPHASAASTVAAILKGRDLAIAFGALGGVVALAASLYELARDEGYAALWRRIVISLFSGVLVACIGLAIALPPSPASGTLALLSVFGALALAGHVAAVALQNTREPLLRTTAAAALLGFLASTVGIGLSRFAFAAQEPFASLVLWLPRIAELLWLIAPIPVLTDTRVAGERIKLGRAVAGWLVAAALLAPLFLVLSARRETFATFLSALSHVGLFAETRAIFVYPAFMLMTASLAMVQLFQRDPIRVHVGAASLFWLVAGAAPRTPVRALYVVLFFLLLGRIARATKAVFGARPSMPPASPVPPPANERLH